MTIHFPEDISEYLTLIINSYCLQKYLQFVGIGCLTKCHARFLEKLSTGKGDQFRFPLALPRHR